MTAAITYQSCRGCGHIWWFRRELCPHCGHRFPEDRPSAGDGRVAAVTVVHRAPSAAWRPLTPYTIVLVWLDEGFRVMGHAEPGVAIGDRVRARSERRPDGVVPVFSRA